MPPDMPLPDGTESAPPSTRSTFWRKILGKSGAEPSPVSRHLPQNCDLGHQEPMAPPAAVPTARRVITGLPRAQTFKRQQSEQRLRLSPVRTSAEERRASSVDRRAQSLHNRTGAQTHPRASAPCLLSSTHLDDDFRNIISESQTRIEGDTDEQTLDQLFNHLSSTETDQLQDPSEAVETQSMTTSQHEAMISDELEKTWILNLSMHFRDRSQREKFFVTYREKEHLWRRVTISLDYRHAPPNSLEMDLKNTLYQREKSAKIYEAIRESLPDIKFYDTVTNLKLETIDGRLHVHVVEDGNEIINYPHVSQVRHLGCRRFRESDIVFDSHMSGFVYKVRVKSHTLIKKEIPSQDTIEEFLYEVNALNSLQYSNDVVRFYGVVVDDCDEYVKGLLISYASQGALIDIIYEHCKENGSSLPWANKAKWARQIVQGLADIHDSGFVQGDFTLSNIVIDEGGDAKIIDINRRGCPVGWEPPEATALINVGHRITMYIGVKSDLYQLGMVLWGLAVEEDEPEIHGRPLVLGPEVNVPDWYRQVTEICLSADPRMRLQASSLLQLFPAENLEDGQSSAKIHSISVDDGHSLNEYFVDGNHVSARPRIKVVEPPIDWPYSGRTYVDTSPVPYEMYYPTRGRSPPSPLPSDVDLNEVSTDPISKTSWAANTSVRPSYTDIAEDETMSYVASQQQLEHDATPTMEDRTLSMQAELETRNSIAAEAVDCQVKSESLQRVGHQRKTNEANVMEFLGEGQAAEAQTNSGAKVPTMPKLTREQTAIRAELPLSKAAAASPANLKYDAQEGTQSSDRGSMADVVQQSLRQEAVMSGQAAGGIFNDIDKVAHDEPRSFEVSRCEKKSGNDLASIESNDESQKVITGEQGAGAESEPDHMAAQRPRDAIGSTEMNDAVTRSEEVPPMVQKRSMPGVRRLLHARLQDQPPKRDCPRHMDLPISLAGVGAAHMGIDDELMREKGILDDDFDMLLRPATMPAFVMTTDALP
ncbi:hypothetical protein HIM_02566 [Hirsutella minnesotensis 3608]|nr:hypothetical protein HIM_02566 [Hirsutella minnesotensis 3608]